MGRTIENQFLGFSLNETPLETIARNMHPNKDFIYGFLGVEENLAEIIEEDKEKLGKLGISYEIIASAIEKLFLSDEEVVNETNYIIRNEFIYSPVCPWRDYCTASIFDLIPKVTEIIVVNGKKGQECVDFIEKHTGKLPLDVYSQLVKRDLAMIFSDIHPHLIRDHQFFEGHSTPYRVDPERAIRYLGIKSNS